MSAVQHRRRTPNPAKALAITASVLLVLLGAGIYGTVRYLRSGDDSDRTVAFAAVQEFVKTKAGFSGRFSSIDETSFQSAEDGKMRVIGEMDVVSPEGRGSRYSYTVLMHKGPDGNWIADDVSLVPV